MTKPCPQCGSAVPLQARFCGQCGSTFAEAGGRSIPTTVDEATADPPPVQPAPPAAPPAAPPRPRPGMATVIGHSAASPVAAPPHAGPAPAPARVPVPTALGPAVMPPPAAPASPAQFGRTMFDPAPYGATESPAHSQRPTPLVPAPHEPDLEPDRRKSGLAQTVSDPDIAERARQVREMALADSRAKQNPETPGPVAADRDAPPHRVPAFGKTMMLGGTEPTAPSSSSPFSAVTAESPAHAPIPSAAVPSTDAPAARAAGADASPLSRSVVAPTGMSSLTSANSVQTAPHTASTGPGPSAGAAGPTANDVGSDKRTMFGMPATGLPAPAPAPPQPQPQALPPTFKTMLGVALPGIAPTNDKPASPVGPAPVQRAGTLLGVAAPGIAPMQPGPPHRAPTSQAAHHGADPRQPGLAPAPAGLAPAPANLAPAPAIVPAPAPLVVEPLPEAPQVPRKKGVPAIAVVGIIFVLVALIGTGAALVIMRSGAPLAAQPQLDETGKESLKIRCESCPDGTTISLGASSSKVEGGATLLPLPAPLSIGDNDLEMKIDRPASGRDETVKVHVPVAYRVKADLATLTTAPAAITVRIEALPGTEVTVDGKPVALDDSGKGAQTIDVTSEVEGPSDEQKAIDKKIPFTIQAKGAAAPESGQLVVRAGVAPLHLDAPGLELYTDRATGNVSGQVKPGATLTIDGQNVAVDADGRFGVRVELPANGEKTISIVTSAPPLAPRTVRSKLTRVASLEAAAKELEAKSPLRFDAYGADPKSKIGQLALVEGEIQEVRVSQGHTVMAVEEKKACSAGPAACLVRVVHGEEVKAARGDTIRAFGRVEGMATFNGQSIPDVEGALVLTKPAGKK